MKNLTALMKKAKERKSQHCFVVEGCKMCMEAPREWVRAMYVSESFAEKDRNQKLLEGYTYELVSDKVFAAVSDTQTPQGILAVVEMPEYQLSDLLRGEKTNLLILESIQDPGNRG